MHREQSSSPNPSRLRHLLLTPWRLAVGWPLDLRRHGFLAVLTMVLLRLVVGWHFFHEGLDKYRSGNFDAKGFLTIAKGPFAQVYHDAVWDFDGRVRLDPKTTTEAWQRDLQRAAQHFGFDANQLKDGERALARSRQALEIALSDGEGDLQEYRLGLERLSKLEADPSRSSVASLRGQRVTIEQEVRRKAAPTLATIDKIWSGYQTSLNSLASTAQQVQGVFELDRPRTGMMVDTSFINPFIPWFDMIVGLSMLLGVLTPVGALAAGGFLLSVFFSQFPPTTGPGSTYYQLAESMACFAIAGFGAGRYAGFDFFIHALIRKLWH
jgi:uncharacterized membrane protein YphA (DoxX/SURF4 family)